MNVTKLLTVTAAVLLATLVAQVNLKPSASVRAHPTTSPLWRHDPPDFPTLAKAADQVVRGVVTSVIPRKPSLQTVIPLPGEARDGVDVVDYDAVTLQVVDVDKPGTVSFSRQTNRTGAGSLAVPGPGPGDLQAWPLEDNEPPYAEGHEYILFLRKCTEPNLQPEQEWMVMGAKGRFRVIGGIVVPTVPKGRSFWIDAIHQAEIPADTFEGLIRQARQQ